MISVKACHAPFSNATGSEAASTSASGSSLVGSGLKSFDDILKVISPTLMAFITNMPAVEGTITLSINQLI